MLIIPPHCISFSPPQHRVHSTTSECPFINAILLEPLVNFTFLEISLIMLLFHEKAYFFLFKETKAGYKAMRRVGPAYWKEFPDWDFEPTTFGTHELRIKSRKSVINSYIITHQHLKTCCLPIHLKHSVFAIKFKNGRCYFGDSPAPLFPARMSVFARIDGPLCCWSRKFHRQIIDTSAR